MFLGLSAIFLHCLLCLYLAAINHCRASQLGKAPKNTALICFVFQTRFRHSPPGFLKFLGDFQCTKKKWSFGHFLCHKSPKLWGKKCQQTFEFGQAPTLFYQKFQNCWCTKKSPKTFGVYFSPTRPPGPSWSS